MVLSQYKYRRESKSRNSEIRNRHHFSDFPNFDGSDSSPDMVMGSPLKRAVKYQFKGPRPHTHTQRKRCNMKDGKTRQGGPVQDRDIHGFNSVKLPAQVGKFKIPKLPSPRNSPGGVLV